MFQSIQTLKKLKENPLYARFQTTDQRIVRILVPRAVNKTLVKTWKETTVTLKVLGRPKKDLDGNPIQYPANSPIRHQVIAVSSDNPGLLTFILIYLIKITLRD